MGWRKKERVWKGGQRSDQETIERLKHSSILNVIGVKQASAIRSLEARTDQMQPIYDTETLNALRGVLDDVLNDPLFPRSKAISTLELAEFVLHQAAGGERNPNAIKLAVRLMVEGVSSQAA